MIKDQVVPEADLEDIPLYANIMKSAIMKVSTRPEIFPCAELIGWILPLADTSTMILANTEKQVFVAYNPAYIMKTFKLPTLHIYMTEKWMKELDLNVFDCVKKMIVIEK